MNKSYSVGKIQLSSKKNQLNSLMLALIIAASLSACKPNAAVTNEAQETKALTDASVSSASPSPASLVQTTTPLANVMATFASSTPAAWNVFDHVADIKWRDPAPVANAEQNEQSDAHTRSGNLLLLGFGEKAVPDGKVGAAAGIKNENEGLSGLTLNGSETEVETIVIRKFHPQDNYVEVISRQFPDDTKMTLIADNCVNEYSRTEENDHNNKFFRLDLSKSSSVYMEGSVDKDGGNSGPGYTNYIFYRVKPTDRMKHMSCHQI
jgi:hypothetical protein